MTAINTIYTTDLEMMLVSIRRDASFLLDENQQVSFIFSIPIKVGVRAVRWRQVVTFLLLFITPS